MKKYSFLLSGLALLMLGAGTVNAETITPGVADGSQLIVRKDLNLTEGVLSPKTTFTFTIKGDNTATGTDKQDNLTVYAGKVDGMTKTEVTVDYTNQDKQADKEKQAAFDFSSVQFEKVGIYRYVVTENKGAIPGITYSEQEYTVDVYVLNDGDTVKPKYIVSKNKDKQKEPIKFDNKLATTSLKVKKSVTGNAGDRSEKFKFTLTVNPSDEYEAGSIIKINVQSEEKEIKIGTPFEFNLANTDTALIEKLPVGITYTVSEVAEGYEQSATLLNGDKEQEYKLGDTVTSDETNDEITVTNTKNVNTPTGVAMTIAPYAAVTLVGVGGALYLLKKKKA